MQKSSPKWGDMPKEEEKKQGAGNVPSEKKLPCGNKNRKSSLIEKKCKHYQTFSNFVRILY